MYVFFEDILLVVVIIFGSHEFQSYVHAMLCVLGVLLIGTPNDHRGFYQMTTPKA